MSAAVSGTFSPAQPVKRGGEAGRGGNGPSSNTGQKSTVAVPVTGAGAIIDFLTVVFPGEVLEEAGLTDLGRLLSVVFGLTAVQALPIRERMWQFYRLSSVLVDGAGEHVGRIGLDGNGGTVCVSLSGAGTRWVDDWHHVHAQLDALGGRISRCDVAHDDLDGRYLDVHALRELANAGEFAEGGRPPKSRFLSDEGHGTGSTLYVGSKGHKELCAYEKGKQLGLPESPWVRVEVRLYGKHAPDRQVPLGVLLDPVSYLRGSYRVLAGLIRGACSKIATEKAKVQASATALVRWLKRQAGQSLGVIFHALGGDAVSIVDALSHHVARSGLPGRFRGAMSATEVQRELSACLAS